ncbi:MAG: tetratricopeptide repeat protein [Melioribacteraceae bacterium]|nr:tetratricopeptide repeat protein [Melioribacteraceae bacterium]
MNRQYILILTSLLFVINNSFRAQSEDITIEDLSSQVEKDDKWVDGMNLLVEQIIDTETTSAKEYLTEVISVAEELGYKKGLVDANILFAYLLNTQNKFSEAIKILEKTGGKVNDDSTLAKVEMAKGVIYYERSEYDSAKIFLDRAEILLKGVENLTFAKIVNTRAGVYSKRGDYTRSIEEAVKAARIFSKYGDEKSLALTYNNIAARNCSLNLHSKAIGFYKMAIRLNEKNQDQNALTMNYINLGVTYKNLDSLDLALIYYQKGLENSKKLENPEYYYAQGYSNIASVYLAKDDFTEALKYYQKSLEVCREANIVFGYVFVFVNLGQTYSHLGNYSQALTSLDSSLHYAEKLNLVWEKSMIYSIYSEVHEKHNNFKEALSFLKKQKVISDSLMTSEKAEKILEIETKYETALKENSILKLESITNSQGLYILYLIVGVLLLFALALWLYLRSKLISQKNKSIQLNEEKLQLELQIKNQSLIHKAINVAQLEDNNELLKLKLENIVINTDLDKNKELKKIIRNLDSSKENSEIWNEFELRFKETHGDFYSKLIQEFPNLTTTELKVISFIRLNMNTKEIAQLTNRSVSTIENTRNSIRRKMNLDVKENLSTKILAY